MPVQENSQEKWRYVVSLLKRLAARQHTLPTNQEIIVMCKEKFGSGISTKKITELRHVAKSKGKIVAPKRVAREKSSSKKSLLTDDQVKMLTNGSMGASAALMSAIRNVQKHMAKDAIGRVVIDAHHNRVQMSKTLVENVVIEE